MSTPITDTQGIGTPTIDNNALTTSLRALRPLSRQPPSGHRTLLVTGDQATFHTTYQHQGTA